MCWHGSASGKRGRTPKYSEAADLNSDIKDRSVYRHGTRGPPTQLNGKQYLRYDTGYGEIRVSYIRYGARLQHLPRNRLALALIVSLHLLAALILTQEHPRFPAQPKAKAKANTITILLLPAEQPAPRSEPPSSLTFVQRQDRVVKKATRVLPTIPKYTEPTLSKVVPPPSPGTAATPTASDTTPTASSIENSDSSVASPKTRSDFSIDIALAKRQARRIAKEMDTGGKVLTQANTPWTHFRNELSAAHVEPVNSVHWESYTASDGTIIYREHIGNQIVCHRSGNVAHNDIAPTGGVDSAGYVSCPSHVEWKREP